MKVAGTVKEEMRKWDIPGMMGNEFGGFSTLHLLIIIIPSFAPVAVLLCRLRFITSLWHPATTISLPLIKKTDIHNTKLPNQNLLLGCGFSVHERRFSCDQPEWHEKRPIIGYSKQLFTLFAQSSLKTGQLMTAPADHEGDMMGALGQHSVAPTWRKRRRMFEHVVDRPEMWMTNDRRWFLIKLMSVLFVLLCLIE